MQKPYITHASEVRVQYDMPFQDNWPVLQDCALDVSGNTILATVTSVLYVALPFLILEHRSAWTAFDWLMALYVITLSVGSTGFHAERNHYRLGKNYSDKNNDNTKTRMFHYLDTAGITLVVLTMVLGLCLNTQHHVVSGCHQLYLLCRR